MSTTKVELRMRLDDYPEIVWRLRNEMAAMLRDVADAEDDAIVAERLRLVAAQFEAGVSDE